MRLKLATSAMALALIAAGAVFISVYAAIGVGHAGERFEQGQRWRVAALRGGATRQQQRCRTGKDRKKKGALHRRL